MRKIYAAILVALVSVHVAKAQTVLYSEDYQGEECTNENVDNYWSRSWAKAGVSLVTDEETGNKYWEAKQTDGKNRMLYTRWTTDADAFYGDHKKYVLEFDAALQKGTIATWQELAIISELSVWPFNDKKSNEGLFYDKNFDDGGTFFEIMGTESGKNQQGEVPLDGTYIINQDAEDAIELPILGWCHFSFDVDVEANKMHAKIVNSENQNVILDRDFEIDDAITGYKPIGIYLDNTKNYGTIRIDNIKITATDDVVNGISQIVANKTAQDTYYTLSGLKVNKPTTAGVYVHGNKKVVVK